MTMKKDKDFKYILRYLIDPEFYSEDRIPELVDFCISSRIKEVMLLFHAEELSIGFPTIQQSRPYVEMSKKIRIKLRENDIDISLNPWATVYHVSRGRQLQQCQNFTMMVGETGQTNGMTVCPLCRQWQKYICELFSYFTGEIQPAAIWIEDDWRLHNHDDSLGWGGCFCDLHLDIFSKMVNENVTREQVLKKILSPGKPHLWRKFWLDLSKKTLLEPLEKLSVSIRRANPSTRVGLMTSRPDIHSAEGRDWNALRNAVSGGSPFLIRPHLQPYTETTAVCSPPAETRFCIAHLESPSEIYPELENSPRCGKFSKSGKFTNWQCFNSAIYGSSGITINHYDMMGNGIALDKSYGDYLSKSKPVLDQLACLDINESNSEGVNILFSPEIALHKYSDVPFSFDGICQDSSVWSKTFYHLGISHKFTNKVEDRIGTYAVNGDTLRAFDDEQVRLLLSKVVFLDAMSVEILLERGFGHFIGIKEAVWQRQDQIGYSYESIQQADAEVYGLAYPRMSAQRCSDRCLSMKCTEDVIVKSSIHKYDHGFLFPGLGTYKNSLGGKIILLAYPFDNSSQFFMGFFNIFRQTMFRNILLELSADSPIAFSYTPFVSVYRNSISDGILLSVFNNSTDDTDQLFLGISVCQNNYKDIKLLSGTGVWKAVDFDMDTVDYSRIRFTRKTLSYLEGLFILLS